MHPLSHTTPLAHTAALACVAALVACSNPAPEPPTFPRALALELLDTDAPQTLARVRARWPDAAHTSAPLETYTPAQPSPIDHVVVFRDVRSARARSVVVKLSADLTDAQRADVLASTQLAAWAALKPPKDPEHVWTLTEGTRSWRARWRDVQGRLTVTVEAARITSSGS